VNLAKVNVTLVDNCTNDVQYSGCANYNPYYRRNLCNGFTYPLSKYSHIKASDGINIKQGATLNCPEANVTNVIKATNGGVLPGPAASY
jgi:hypothetical protein